MKVRSICCLLLSALLFFVLAPTPTCADVITLFQDDFYYITTGNSSNSNGSGSRYTGTNNNVQVYDVNEAFQAGGAVRLGSASNFGSLTTTNLAVSTGMLQVAVDVKGWTNIEGDLKISVAGQTTNITYTAVMAGVFESVLASFDVLAGSYAVTVGTTNKKPGVPGMRCFIDNLVISQKSLSGDDTLRFWVFMQSESAVQELSPVSFSITATVGENPANVTYVSGLPVGASYTFVNGNFSWTPTLSDAGNYSLSFSAMGGDGQLSFQTVDIAVMDVPFEAPKNLSTGRIDYNAFDLVWDPMPGAIGYFVGIWTGSSATNTLGCDAETFFEIEETGTVTAPPGWIFTGIGSRYSSTTSFVELSLDATGDAITTRFYPSAVTNLEFHLQGRGSGTHNNEVRVWASVDGLNWTDVGVYSSVPDDDGDDENNIFTLSSRDVDKNLLFPASAGYRQFKFVFTKVSNNVGIGKIAAMYEGAGTQFLSGWQDRLVSATSVAVPGVRPNTVYYVRVGSIAAGGTKTEYTTIRLQTIKAPPTTILTVR